MALERQAQQPEAPLRNSCRDPVNGLERRCLFLLGGNNDLAGHGLKPRQGSGCRAMLAVDDGELAPSTGETTTGAKHDQEKLRAIWSTFFLPFPIIGR
jgi:hypothetical protein